MAERDATRWVVMTQLNWQAVLVHVLDSLVIYWRDAMTDEDREDVEEIVTKVLPIIQTAASPLTTELREYLAEFFKYTGLSVPTAQAALARLLVVDDDADQPTFGGVVN